MNNYTRSALGRRSVIAAAAVWLACTASCGARSELLFPSDGSNLLPTNTSEFRIDSLDSTGCTAVEHNMSTGDDRGGIAASSTSVFYSGDQSTARFDSALAGPGRPLGVTYDGLTGNLHTGQVYALSQDGAAITSRLTNRTRVTELIELDGQTGLPTGAIVRLSAAVTLGGTAAMVGIFAGYDRVVMLANGRALQIALPSGTVTDLGAMASPRHSSCESWAFWGTAENFGGSIYVDFVESPQVIARVRVPDGSVTALARFSSLSDMCSFTVTPSSGRWYFHHEGQSQFRSGDETLGFCSATFTVR